MHLKRQSCRGIPGKAHPVGSGFLVGILLILVAVSSALAWNKAGHMVAGAIAYADLQQNNPETLARVVALLKTHPHFATKWAPRLAQLHLTPEEHALSLFMLAARWPDDIREDPIFHHGPWHYINWTLAFFASLRWLIQKALQDWHIISQSRRLLAGRLQQGACMLIAMVTHHICERTHALLRGGMV